jgi:hypothetical protein
LILSGLALLIDHEEGAIFREILNANASKVEHTPSTILDIFAPKGFLEIGPRKPGADHSARERCPKDRSSSDINTGLLRMLENEQLGTSFNRSSKLAHTVRKHPATGGTLLLLFKIRL